MTDLADASEPDGTAQHHSRDLAGAWRRERRFVAAVLLAHMPRTSDLEDLLQEVALKLVRHGEDLRDGRRLRQWLRTVAINTAREAARRSESRQQMGESSADVEQVAAPAVGDPTAQDAAMRVLDLIQRLPEKYREPLLMRCVQGFSQKRIAEHLNLSETTVETRLARARRRLREALASQETVR